eukprot:8746661-Alexandrium_andersonii.AAC.1
MSTVPDGPPRAHRLSQHQSRNPVHKTWSGVCKPRHSYARFRFHVVPTFMLAFIRFLRTVACKRRARRCRARAPFRTMLRS